MLEQLDKYDLSTAFERKRLHRLEKARLPFEEKLKVLVALQKFAKPMRERLGKRSVVWEI